MTSRFTTARNIAIILLLAAALDFLPGGGTTAAVTIDVIWLAMLALLAWAGWRFYRSREIELFSLATRTRVVLYGSVALIALVLTATARLRATPIGTAAWIVALVLGVYGIIFVVREQRQL